ncbi:hypothetical protein D3C80_1933020 [compost metagenome]
MPVGRLIVSMSHASLLRLGMKSWPIDVESSRMNMMFGATAESACNGLSGMVSAACTGSPMIAAVKPSTSPHWRGCVARLPLLLFEVIGSIP